MNNLLKINLVLFVLLFFLACSEDDELNSNQDIISNIHLLKTDSRFIYLIKSNFDFINRDIDAKIVKKLTEKEFLSENEINQLAISLGFQNVESYNEYLLKQNKVLNELNLDYDLFNIEKSKLITLIMETIESEISLDHARTGDCNCERIRRNCLFEVTAIATAAHLACVAVDWTGIGAPLCHSAAVVYQIAASDNCNANAENCLSNCNN